MTNDCDSITKNLVRGVKLMSYKKILTMKSKGQCKDKCHKKSYIFLHNNDCETTYRDIYIDLLLINFYCPYFSIMLTVRSVILRCTNNNI